METVSVIKMYNGRSFVDGEFCEVLERVIVRLSKNNVWLYTVDKILEKDAHE